MRISAKGEYAIKAMVDLAMHRGRALVPIQEIATRDLPSTFSTAFQGAASAYGVGYVKALLAALEVAPG